MSPFLSFHLSDTFLAPYKDQTPDWGFKDPAGNSLGEGAFLRSYSRRKEDGSKEQWWEVCRRSIEGMYSIQKDHCKAHHLPWQDKKAQRSAQRAYDLLFTFKWSLPGRGLWAMGTEMVNKNKDSSSLQNCSFISTENIHREGSAPFRYLQEASMLGIGVGFDTKGSEHEIVLRSSEQTLDVHVIPDTREGWVEATGVLIDAFLQGTTRPIFDYCQIRPEGAPIKTFGGVAAGPAPLIKLHETLTSLFETNIGQVFDSRLITDVCNLIGVCTVSGNVRRSALVSIGEAEDDVFLNLKNYERYPYRSEWGWMSNNSIKATPGMDYSSYVPRIVENGEPGIFWLSNAHSFKRMNGVRADNDTRTKGGNPCLAYDTMMLTDGGLKKIGDLVGRKFKVWNGSEYSDSNAWYTGDKEAVKITFSNGLSVTLTKNHVLKTHHRNSNPKLKGYLAETEAGNLVVGSQIVPLNGSGKWEGLSVDPDTAVLLGLLLGDGSSQINGGRASYIRTKEQEVINFVLSYGERNGFQWSYIDDQLRLLGVDVLFSSDFDEMRKHPLPERSIPADVFTWDSQSVKFFLRGLFSANGGAMPKHARIDLKTTCHELATDVQLLLNALGLNSYITTNKPVLIEWSNGEYVSKKSYDVNVTGPYRYRMFQSEIGFLHVHKSLPSIKQGGRNENRPVTVTAIEDAGVIPVYDFTEPFTHWGWANGIQVHNCMEIILESSEKCTLAEVFASNCDNYNEFEDALKCAFLYAKTVTLLPTRWEQTNAVMQRNRRIGTSISGLAEMVDRHGYGLLRDWMNRGYDEISRLDVVYSEWLAVRESVRTTTIKPSGTISLLAGVTPGVHWPVATTYIRRMRLSNTDALLQAYKDSGYRTEPAFGTEETTTCVEIPMRPQNEALRNHEQVSIHEKIYLAAFAQRNWADNGVSVTVTFDRQREGNEIARVLSMYDDALKAVSFLPIDNDSYPQMPYQSLTEEEMDIYMSSLTLLPIDWSGLYVNGTEAEGEAGCVNDTCLIKAEKVGL